MLTKPFKPLALAFLVNLIISVEDKIKIKYLQADDDHGQSPSVIRFQNSQTQFITVLETIFLAVVELLLMFQRKRSDEPLIFFGQT